LAAAFVAVSLAPPLRALFALSPLGFLEVGLVVTALAAWTTLVRWAWRGRVLERFLVSGHEERAVMTVLH